MGDPHLLFSPKITIHPLHGIGEVNPGDQLSSLLKSALGAAGLLPLLPRDVLVVTQKVVSKAEDRFVDLATVLASPEAERLADVTKKPAKFVHQVLAEATGVVRAAPQVLITRHRLGHVMANSGIDRSNTGGRDGDWILLLPIDPDASASDLCLALGCAVIISDSFGRPWRHGVVGVAIGASGLLSLLDRRGELDRDGRRLEGTQVALADMIASAAALVTGEGAEGVPAVLVRGLSIPNGSAPASSLVRGHDEDLFR